MIDRELPDLPEPSRRAEWRARIEAALFASSHPLPVARLAPLVGARANIAALLEDIAFRLNAEGRPWELARQGEGWVLRTKPAYAAAIRLALGRSDDESLVERSKLSRGETLALAAVAYHQPITRDGMEKLFGMKISRDVLSALIRRGWISNALTAPLPGAPRAYMTTELFLTAFGLETLDDLPPMEEFAVAG